MRFRIPSPRPGVWHLGAARRAFQGAGRAPARVVACSLIVAGAFLAVPYTVAGSAGGWRQCPVVAQPSAGATAIGAKGTTCRKARLIAEGFLNQESGSSGATVVAGFGCSYQTDRRVACVRRTERVRFTVVLSGDPPVPGAPDLWVYLPECGGTFTGLDIKPRSWSPGCAGASPLFKRLRWRGWGRRTARAHGTVLVCVGAEGCTQSRGSIRTSRIRRCDSPAGPVRTYTKTMLSVGKRSYEQPLGCPTP